MLLDKILPVEFKFIVKVLICELKLLPVKYKLFIVLKVLLEYPLNELILLSRLLPVR